MRACKNERDEYGEWSAVEKSMWFCGCFLCVVGSMHHFCYFFLFCVCSRHVMDAFVSQIASVSSLILIFDFIFLNFRFRFSEEFVMNMVNQLSSTSTRLCFTIVVRMCIVYMPFI